MQQTNIMHFTEQLQNNRTMHNVLVSAECSDIQLHNIRLLPNIENPVSVGPYQPGQCCQVTHTKFCANKV